MKIIQEGDNLFKIESASKKGKFYKINLEKNTCDCPDWIYRESKKHADCKHLKEVKKQYAIKEKPSKHIDEMHKILLVVEEKGEVPTIELIDTFGESIVNELINQGELIETKGKIKRLA